MACKLVYNNEGQFVKALTPDGKESSLFKQILSIPHIRSVKEASELYANIFAKKMYFIMGEKGAKRLDDFYKNQDKSISLVKAKEMKESSDFSDKDIKIQTNWELGADGMWRYEVPPILDIKEKDGDLILNELREKAKNLGRDLVVSDIVSEEINIAYPELSSVKIDIETELGKNSVASYDPATKTIKLSGHLY